MDGRRRWTRKKLGWESSDPRIRAVCDRLRAGATYREIAQEFDISIARVGAIRERAGIERRYAVRSSRSANLSLYDSLIEAASLVSRMKEEEGAVSELKMSSRTFMFLCSRLPELRMSPTDWVRPRVAGIPVVQDELIPYGFMAVRQGEDYFMARLAECDPVQA